MAMQLYFELHSQMCGFSRFQLINESRERGFTKNFKIIQIGMGGVKHGYKNRETNWRRWMF